MPKHPIKIGGHIFASKDEAEQYVREFMIDNVGDIYQQDDEYKFLCDLTHTKPSNFKITEIGKKACHLDIVTRVSWRKLARQSQKKRTPNAELNDAMRNAIKSQKPDYSDAICSTPGCDIVGRMQADHIYSFDKIKREFLYQTDHEIPTQFVDSCDGSRMFCKDGGEFVRDWCQFHADKVKWQPLCSSCNIKKSNN